MKIHILVFALIVLALGSGVALAWPRGGGMPTVPMFTAIPAAVR